MKRDLVIIECDFCGNHDSIDVRQPGDKVLPLLRKWRGVMDGDSPPGGGAESHRWYDTLECLLSGERSHESKKRESELAAQEQAEQTARANEAMRTAGYLKDDEVAKVV